jgi:hypothetical protein
MIIIYLEKYKYHKNIKTLFIDATKQVYFETDTKKQNCLCLSIINRMQDITLIKQQLTNPSRMQ